MPMTKDTTLIPLRKWRDWANRTNAGFVGKKQKVPVTYNFLFSLQPLILLRINFHHQYYYSCRMFSWWLWCHRSRGDHVGKKEKLWTSLKPLRGKNWNLAQVKCSPWETSAIFYWWHHRWLHYNVIIAYVECFIWTVWKIEGHLGLNCMGKKKLMMSLVTWFGSHFFFGT